MNALMTIQVRVASGAALAELKALQAQMNKTAVSGIGGMTRQAGWGIPVMAKWGNQVQWMGRQLMYNFTLPIALAMGASAKWALENEKAMTRVEKVYGDGSKVFRRLSETEIPALGEAFEALSSRFGIHQQEVINIAGDWAAAGASGLALAKVVKLTLETMVLGELEAAEATRELIAIQAQYGMDTKQLTKTIDTLNMAENQTGTSMRDLMNAMSRASGVAKTAGVDVEHLVAMVAALVPASGTAATAGNGLKTMISRLLSPTEDAVAVMQAMGVQVREVAWESLSGTQRLEAMATAYGDLSDVQKVHVATLVASRWQLNRFSVLMDAINNQNSYYHKTLDATSDRQRIFTQRVFELNKVLESNPQRVQQAWVILQNALADVIIPMIPYIVYLASEIARLGHAFQSLDPEIQKMVLGLLVFIALIGPITRLIGSTTVLMSVLITTTHFLGAAFLRMAGFIVGPVIFALDVLAGALIMIGAGLMWAFTRSMMGAVAALKFLVLQVVAFTRILALAGVMTPIFTAMAAVWAGITGIFIAGGTATLGVFTAWLSTMWTAIYVWGVGAAARFRASMFLIGTVFTLLPSMFIAAMGTLWAYLTTIGLLSGRILAIWGTMTAGMAVIWAWLTTRIMMLWTLMWQGLAAIQAAFAAAWVALTTGLMLVWSTLLTNMRFLWAATWAFIAAVPTMIVPAITAVMGAIVAVVATGSTLIMAALASPWTWAIVAVLGLIYAFRDRLADAWYAIGDQLLLLRQPLETVAGWFGDLSDLIMEAFWALPESVQGAMIAVLTVIRDAAMQIYEWMSYLNPFARHSPSLVDSVTKGMDVIEQQYGRAAGLGSIFAAAAADLAKFKKMTSGLMNQGEFGDERADVAAFIPKALPLFDKLVGHLRKLRRILAEQEAAVNAQQAVVDRWQKKLDAANAALDRQQDKLDRLGDKLNKLKDAYDAAEQAMQNYASAPIEGMGAMGDAIFENELAQKKLRLEMLKWEEQNGTIDSMRDRLGLLQGDIETLRGRAAELRAGGAGSDILGPIEQQIAAMEAQAAATQEAIHNSPMGEMEKQMEELRRQGEMLQLQYDINYDPLTRQIEQLANAQQELSYEEIIAGIKEQQAVMAQLQPQIDAATAAYDQQAAAVAHATEVRDAIQASYDAEAKHLDRLNEKYQRTADLVRDIEGALNDMAAAAQQASGAASGGGPLGAAGNAVQTFQAGAGLNFPDVGGDAAINREGGLEDQSKLIEQFTQDTLDEMSSVFGGMDMFGPIKKQWNRLWGWIEDNLGPIGKQLQSGIESVFGGLGDGIGAAADSNIVATVMDIFDTLGDVFGQIGEWVGDLWKLIGPDVVKIGKAFVKFGRDLWNKVGPELEKFGEIFHNLGPALENFWQAIKPFVMVVVGVVAGILKLITSVLAEVAGPIFNMIVGIIKGIIKVIRGVFEVIIGLMSGDWQMAWDGVVSIVEGVFGGLWSLLSGIALTLWGVVEGIVKGIVGFFQWLWDVLLGHSIIPDIINGIWKAFKGLIKLAVWIWNNILKPIWGFFKDLWKDHIRPEIAAWWERLKTAWNKLKDAGIWFWENVLKPIWVGAKAVWKDYIKPELSDWWERIKNVWDKLKKAGEWITTNVMDPVVKAFKDGWNAVKGWFDEKKDWIVGGMKSIVRGLVNAINWIIKGLNKLDALPGVTISIGEIELPDDFAQGGIPRRRVGGGFETQGARAIVGEGKPNYPEFVIPTDPTYRNRAQSLLASAAERLNMAATPKYAGGGMLGSVDFPNPGSIIDLAGESWDKLKDLGAAAWNNVMDGFFEKASNVGNKIPWRPGRQMADGAIDTMKAWVKIGSEEWAEQFKAQKAKQQQAGTFDFKAGDWERVTWRGHQMDAGHVRSILAAEAQYGSQFEISQGSYRPYTSYSGETHMGGGAADITSPVNMVVQNLLRKYGQAAWIRQPTSEWKLHIHTLMIGDPNLSGAAAAQVRDFQAGGDGLAKMASGGIIQRQLGGRLALLGEGRNDEAVIPLPNGWRNDAFMSGDGGDRTLNFYGDLSFPNIKNGDDAETFITNLENLAS